MDLGIVKTINNDSRSTFCPCCKSNLLSLINSIKYARNIQYSGSLIKLNNRPELWKCQSCESWFTQNRVNEDESKNLYSNGSSWNLEKVETSRTEETLLFIKSLITKDQNVLDVGCANGALLDFIKENGAKTYGLEYSSEHRKTLEKKGHFTYSNWSEVHEVFDVIIAFDLIEHLYNIELFFECCGKYLAKGGLLLIMTGNIDSSSAKQGKEAWWYVRYPEHILFPSSKYYSSLEQFKLISFNEVYPYIFSNTTFAKKISTINNLKIAFKILLSRMIDGNKYSPSLKHPPDHALILLEKR
jgi:2-polyprenyl-3-methyl-5-hydroxy-6-metoxy-1,4-benzoquinol methylase